MRSRKPPRKCLFANCTNPTAYVFIGEVSENKWARLMTESGHRIGGCELHTPEMMVRLTALPGAPQRIRAVPRPAK
jgi:hypothetical protein